MAKLLDRPFTSEEKRQVLDMLQGNINRVSVSNDIEEIVCQLNFAVDRLSAVAYSRIKELTEERLPREPKENPVFDDKPLELYLVDMGGSYPLRAFWNGKQFTDGWSILNVIAWRPLPDPYRPERSKGE